MYKLLVCVFVSVLSITSLFSQGYLLQKDQVVSIWWTEGVYKIMQEYKIPSVKQPIQISSAANESEIIPDYPHEQT